ncbi:hypothetical protein [Methylocystis silviterrae]
MARLDCAAPPPDLSHQISPVRFRALAVGLFRDLGGATRAVVAIGFIVTAANGTIVFGADLWNLHTLASDVSSVALARLGVAPQACVALNAGDACAHLADLGGRDGRGSKEYEERRSAERAEAQAKAQMHSNSPKMLS